MTNFSGRYDYTKKFDGSGITPSYFPALMRMVFFAIFLKIQSQGMEQSATLFFILKVLWCTNNLMQNMTFVTPYPFRRPFWVCYTLLHFRYVAARGDAAT